MLQRSSSSSPARSVSSVVTEPPESHDLILLLQSASSPLRSSSTQRLSRYERSVPLLRHRQPPRTPPHQQEQLSGWFSSPVKVRRPLTFTSRRAWPGPGNDASASRSSVPHLDHLQPHRGHPTTCELTCEGKENRNSNSNTSNSPSRARLPAAHHRSSSSSSPLGPPSWPATSNRLGTRLCLAGPYPTASHVRSPAPPPRTPPGGDELLGGGGGTHDGLEDEQGHVWGVPPEVWVLVFQQLSASDVCACRLTCARWCALASDAAVWRHLYTRDWGHHHHHHNRPTHTTTTTTTTGHHSQGVVWREAYAERWVAVLAECKTAQANSAQGTRLVTKVGPTKHYGGRRGRAGAGPGPTLVRRQQNHNYVVLEAKQPDDPDADGQRRAKRRRRQQRAEEELLQEAEWREAMLRAYFAAIDRESLAEAEASDQ